MTKTLIGFEPMSWYNFSRLGSVAILKIAFILIKLEIRVKIS